MFDEIKPVLQRLEDNEYSGGNAEALRELDVQEVRHYLDAVEEKITSVVTDLQNIL